MQFASSLRGCAGAIGSVAAEAASSLNAYLLAYQRLAGLALEAGRTLWKIRPKWHYMAHHAVDLAGASEAYATSAGLRSPCAARDATRKGCPVGRRPRHARR